MSSSTPRQEAEPKSNGGAVRREQALATMNMAPLLTRMALPAMVAMMSTAAYNLVDAIFVGRGVGGTAIGALAIAFPVQMILIGVGVSLGTGGTSVISRSLGAGQRDRAQHAVGTVLGGGALFGLIVLAAVTVFMTPLLRVLGTPDVMMVPTRDYLSIITLGAPLLVTYIAGSALIRAEGQSTAAMVTWVTGTVVNIVLDPLFIFTFKMGLRGAAIATVIGQGVSVLLVAGFYITGRSGLDLRPSHLWPRLKLLGEAASIGMGTFSRQIGFTLMFAVTNNLLNLYGGPIYLSAYGAYHRLMVFFMLPSGGIIQGYGPIAGYNYGAGNMGRVRKATTLSILVSTVISTLAAAVIYIFPGTLFRMFSTDPELLSIGTRVARIAAIGLPTGGIYMLGQALYMAMGRPMPAIVLGTLRSVLLIPLMIILGRSLGVDGVIGAVPIAYYAATTVTVVMVSGALRRVGSMRPAESNA